MEHINTMHNKSLTTGICVEEKHRSSEYSLKHPVMQHPGGIVGDKVEEDSSQEVQEDKSYQEHTVDDEPSVIWERTGERV